MIRMIIVSCLAMAALLSASMYLVGCVHAIKEWRRGDCGPLVAMSGLTICLLMLTATLLANLPDLD
jgi:hypothetical protein